MIKKEGKELDSIAEPPGYLTTGPLVRSAGVDKVAVKVINRGSASRKLTVTLLYIHHSSKHILDQRTVTVLNKCSILEVFALKDAVNFEVVLSGSLQGITAYVEIPIIVALYAN